MQVESFIVDSLIQCASFYSTIVSSTTLKACIKQISGEVAENISKLAPRNFLIAISYIAVIIDIAEIIYVWKKDRPKAIKQVQAVIKELEELQLCYVFS